MKLENLSAADRAILATEVTAKIVFAVMGDRAMRELSDHDWNVIDAAKKAAREALGVSFAEYTEALFR